ncbi:MAG: CheR family methyltransferase, partial [Shimia sp.]
LVEANVDGIRDEFVDSLTTNVSSFFRQAGQFARLEAEILPALLHRARTGQRVTLWSAGCAEGQEPVSLAIALTDQEREWYRLPIEIIATDVSRKALNKARSGRLPGSIPARVAAHLGPDGALAREIVQSINWRTGNVHDPRDRPDQYALVLCRNVAIYTGDARRSALWRTLSENLEEGGWLAIGHSERITRPAVYGLTAVGDTLYRKG